jgi:hypothetical protein
MLNKYELQVKKDGYLYPKYHWITHEQLVSITSYL